ncbi:MAG: ABC transporter substrate-binding protein [Dehalococcoidia bacterium]|jgi:peptide/nickel transport system substrate-binding protein|nr:ABC transporter substrate-binding protein [Dehalococcoidia bacterium]
MPPPQPPQPARYSRREALRLGVGAVGAAFFVACGGDELPAPPSAPRLSLIDRYARESGERGGVLRLGTVRGMGRSETAWPFIYSPLLGLDPRSNLMYGDLAATLELRDPLTLAITLRPELRFHPDERSLAAALTSDDVRREFETRAAAGEFVFSEVVERVETPDFATLVLHLRAPFGLLIDTLADARAAGIRSEARSPVTGEPLGSGPFVTALRELAGDALGRNELYHHNGYPLLDGVSLLEVEDELALTEAFVAGDIDHLDGVVEYAPEGQVVLERPGFGMLGLGLSLLGEKAGQRVRFVAPFQDGRVRRALSMAIDRVDLAERFDGSVSGPVGPAHRADALPDTELAADPLYTHDPEEARRLLDAAGASDLAIRIQTPTDERPRALAKALEEQLNDGGFDALLLVQEPRDWGRAFDAGDFETTVLDLTDLATPDLGLRLHSSTGIDGAFSPWGYSNPRYDSAVRDALGEIDPSLRAERSRAAQRLLLDDVPAMFPLVVPTERVSLRRALAGFEFDAYRFNDGWLAPRWSLTRSGR